MAKGAADNEERGTTGQGAAAGSGGHSGTAVKQGVRGQSRRAEERGRDEFQGDGASAELDTGRTAEGGRHYGRRAIDEPAPDGGPPGPRPAGSSTTSQDEAGDGEEADPDRDEAPAHTQGQRPGGARTDRR